MSTSFPSVERFLSKINRVPFRCWEWTASRDPDGYGKFGLGRKNGLTGKAHRIMYEMCFGDIPDEALVLHSCNNAGCVNPMHLRLGSNQHEGDTEEEVTQAAGQGREAVAVVMRRCGQAAHRGAEIDKRIRDAEAAPGGTDG